MTYRLQRKQFIALLSCTILFLFIYIRGEANAYTTPPYFYKDSVPTDTKKVDIDTTISGNMSQNHFSGFDVVNTNRADTVAIGRISRQPYVSLQEMLKGNVAGVYSEEPSGEPGTKQYLFIHGLSSPLLGKKDLVHSQPVVYLNGVPISRENPFAYDIQTYDFNRIGPATNLLADLTTDDIASIKVIKDPAALAALGPDASNGAIWVTTKNAHSGFREISIHSYVGFVQKPHVTPVNAAFENDFRQPYYDLYGTTEDVLNYPAYLRDETNKDYYGASNWTDLYYENKPIYSIDMSLTGGSDRANFRFLATKSKSNGNADGTSMDRYGVSFFINMLPLKWLTLSSMIRANRLERNRNKSVRDRLGEERYLPDLTSPLSPNKAVYSQYLNAFNNAVDKNKTNTVQGYFGIKADLGDLLYNGRVSVDYNEGIRDAFWPTTLLEGNNFASNYFGYNLNFIVSNSLSYHFDFGNESSLQLQVEQKLQKKKLKYEYAYAYNGPNDKIKINNVDGNPNHDDYLQPQVWTPHWFPDKMSPRLASYFFKADYTIKNKFKLGAIVRSDGSSNVQPDHRWFMGYGVNGSWNIKNTLLQESSLSEFRLHASYAKIGKLFRDDRFAIGPQYKVDMGWSQEPTMGSYVGIAGLSRPFTAGWVGYDLPWQYSNKLDVGVNIGLLHNRVQAAIDFYKKDDKDLVLPVPVPSEYGYTGAYESGMWIQNTGVDVSISAKILDHPKGLNWLFTANFNTNKNELKALPNGLNEVIIGSRKLKVGASVDQFWLLNNDGIYTSDADVPINPNTNNPMTFNGLALQKGDAKWKDVNEDYVIDNGDKTLQGHFMPKMSGGFGSDFTYKGWDLNFHFYFALGRDILDQYASKRLNFVNQQRNNDMGTVKEITFWEYREDLSKYPQYNPWSDVVPYRSDQDLFLKDGSYLKLGALSVGYDLTRTHLFQGKKDKPVFTKFLIYLSGTNLFTISGFDADDPELTLYNGIYNGHGLPIPRTFIFGVKVNL